MISWWLLITGASQLFNLLVVGPAALVMWADLGINPVAAAGLGFVMGVLHLTAGYGILKGHRWGRTLYLGVGFLGLVLGALFFRSSWAIQAVGLAVYAAFAYFLTRDEADAYFDGTYELPPEEQRLRRGRAAVQAEGQSAGDLKRLFGVLLAVGASFAILMALFSAGIAGGGLALFFVLFFGLPAAGALTAAVFLWGRARWAALVGWTLAGAGAWAAFTGLFMASVVKTEIWETMMTQQGAGVEIGPGAFVMTGLLGAVVMAAGLSLLRRQREADDEAARVWLEREAAEAE